MSDPPPRESIRPALPADIAACVGLSVGEPPTGLADDLGDAERLLLVAERAGRVVGYGRTIQFRCAAGAPAASAPDGYYLVGLAVEPACRRQGVATALTRARLAWVSERATEAWYFANARNKASIALHARMGFREVTRDFSFPGVRFEGGEGILFRVDLAAGGCILTT
jgi:ribosomal protein S18 acetylase RimI-like enzyme